MASFKVYKVFFTVLALVGVISFYNGSDSEGLNLLEKTKVNKFTAHHFSDEILSQCLEDASLSSAKYMPELFEKMDSDQQYMVTYKFRHQWKILREFIHSMNQDSTVDDFDKFFEDNFFMVDSFFGQFWGEFLGKMKKCYGNKLIRL